jgi:cell division protein FtsW (lipid II flippase)
MAITRRTADTRGARRARWTLDRTDVLFFASTFVGVVALSLGYAGRVRTIPAFDRANPPVLLSADQKPAAIANALRDVLPARDRQFASQELARALADPRGSASVRLLLATPVPLARIERAGLSHFAERAHAAASGHQAPSRGSSSSIPLFTERERERLATRFAVRSDASFTATVVTWAAAFVLAFQAVWWLWRLCGLPGDRLLLAGAQALTTLGFALLLSVADPLRDELLIPRFAQGVVVGLGFLAAASLADLTRPAFPRLVYTWLVAAVALSALLLAFGEGPGGSRARVNLGPVQPIEAIRLCLALFLAGYFAKVWELVRSTRETEIGGRRLPPWVAVPRLAYLVPGLVGVSAMQGLFVLQRDLGPALLLACLSLALYGVARGRWPMIVAGAAALVASFWVGARWHLSTTVVSRVDMWRAPWDNAVPGGDQVAGALWALATGGPVGSGLGLGQTQYIRAGHNDLILAAAGEELGFVGLCAVALVFAGLVCRGFSTALRARDDYCFFVATAITLTLIVPVLVMAAGLAGVMPLTGIVTPFLSDGGSAMVANLTALGILAGARTGTEPLPRPSAGVEWTRPFVAPVTAVRAVLCTAGGGLVACLGWVQVVHADDFAVRAHLGPQGDGVRRYQYNPRVLDLIRHVPRGSIVDARGVPLATDDATRVDAAGATWRALGVSLPRPCIDRTSRCYPLGGETFHLLGDDTTRINWTATNTAYVERDQEALLRGFDDHATVVPVVDGQGHRTTALRRDHRALAPMLRHRWEPEHPALAAFSRRDRDVRLTVDARLQHAVATRVASAARQSAQGRAAAVVLDPATGHILAQASYPWPQTAEARPSTPPTPGDGPHFDRARFGSYPPGSAFKLVTATAALRRDVRLAQEHYTCSRLSDGRVGLARPGGRPIRDDVLDRQPHGPLDLHEGLVRSCNAYFAQLAVRLGPEALLETAARLGVSVVAGSQTAARLRGSLAHAGYGQGEVLASPLRMARVAAAIAAGGVLRDAVLVAGSSSSEDEVLLPPEAATLLADYMRDAVLRGTGRTLRGHPARIAGKTGTAEVSGKPSHSWFVGFAPHGAAAKRVAFAVLVENAGYGGQAAAALAGEVVSAAAALELVR